MSPVAVVNDEPTGVVRCTATMTAGVDERHVDADAGQRHGGAPGSVGTPERTAGQ